MIGTVETNQRDVKRKSGCGGFSGSSVQGVILFNCKQDHVTDSECLFMIFIPVAFLAASIVSLAKPVSYDSSDLNSDETWVGIGGNDDLMSSTIPVLQRASTSDKQDDLTLSPGTSMTTNSMIEADSSNAYCSSDGFLNLDALHNLHTRNVVPRQSCSSDIKIPTRNPVKTDGSNAPLINLGSMDQPDHACPYQPHLEKQRLIHVTCGGPTVGDSFTEPDQVINCVPGQ